MIGLLAQPSAPTCQRLPLKFSDSTTSELPEKERDDSDDGQHDSNPEQEVEGLDESAGDQQDDRDDRAMIKRVFIGELPFETSTG